LPDAIPGAANDYRRKLNPAALMSALNIPLSHIQQLQYLKYNKRAKYFTKNTADMPRDNRD